MAFAGFRAVIGHVADADAPVLRVTARVVAARPLAQAARACAHAEAVVLFQPVREPLDVDRLVLALDRALDRNHVHADARAAGRHHLRHLLERQEGHALEERAEFGVVFDLLLVHHRELGRAGHEHGQKVALLVVRVLAVEVFPVVFQDALYRELVEHFLQLVGRHVARFLQFGERHGAADLHMRGERCLFVGHHACQAPVVGVVLRHLHADAVGDLLAFFQHPGLYRFARSGAGCVGRFGFVGHERVVFGIHLFGDDPVRLSVRRSGRNLVALRALLLGQLPQHRFFAFFHRGAAIWLMHACQRAIVWLSRHNLPPKNTPRYATPSVLYVQTVHPR